MRESGKFDAYRLGEIFQDARGETTAAQDETMEAGSSADTDMKVAGPTFGRSLPNYFIRSNILLSCRNPVKATYFIRKNEMWTSTR